MRLIFSIYFVFFLCTLLSAQNAHKLLRNGDEAYRKNDFNNAENEYKSAALKNNSFKAMYNLGNAQFQQKQYQAAAESFEKSIPLTQDAQELSMANYNLGNSYYQQHQLEKAIEAYKESLRKNPTDIDAKKNLTKALQKKQEKDQKEKQDQQDQKNQDQKNQDQQNQQQQNQQQNSQQQNQKNQDQKNQDQQNQQQQNQQQQSQQKQQYAQPKRLSKEEADDLLRIINEEEKNVRKRMQHSDQKAPANRRGKDW